jgi:hypothetical protein
VPRARLRRRREARARAGASLRERGAGSRRSRPISGPRGLPQAIVFAAVEASCDGEPEATWARRARRLGRPHGAKAWRLLASRGFPEDVVLDVVGDPDESFD